MTRVNKTTEKTIGGRVINVVDTPGCMDTEKGKQILDEIAAAVTEHPEGYDAVLIVLKYVYKLAKEGHTRFSFSSVLLHCLVLVFDKIPSC